MLHWVRHLIESYGYAIVVVLVLAEGVGLPVPGETALISLAAAVAAQSHRLTIVGAHHRVLCGRGGRRRRRLLDRERREGLTF